MTERRFFFISSYFEKTEEEKERSGGIIEEKGGETESKRSKYRSAELLGRSFIPFDYRAYIYYSVVLVLCTYS